MKVHEIQLEDGKVNSTNWAGYAVTGSKGAFTDVKASWKVPVAQCSTTNGNGYSSMWVGIDGWGTSTTVEQIGTDSDCVSSVGKTNTPTYYAWFEFYPNPAYRISFPKPIMPGDIITAEVSVAAPTSNGKGNAVKGVVSTGVMFTVTLTDVTLGETFTTSTTVANAQQSSAEWIAEAPCCSSTGTVLPLAPFGIADFGSDYTGAKDSSGHMTTSYATMSGKAGTLGSFGTSVQQNVMVSAKSVTTLKAQPSAISTDGTSFYVQWLNPGP